MPGRIIKPGQVFDANPAFIPVGFRDVLECLTPELIQGASPAKEKILHESETLYKIDPIGRGWFNVVNEEGKIINDKTLRETEAMELLNELENSKPEMEE